MFVNLEKLTELEISSHTNLFLLPNNIPSLKSYIIEYIGPVLDENLPGDHFSDMKNLEEISFSYPASQETISRFLQAPDRQQKQQIKNSKKKKNNDINQQIYDEVQELIELQKEKERKNRSLDKYTNQITFLNENWFKPLKFLKKLKISNCKNVTEIPADLLIYNKQLTILQLNIGKRCTNIGEFTFRRSKNLEELYLYGNGFESFPEKLFYGLYKLEKLVLSRSDFDHQVIMNPAETTTNPIKNLFESQFKDLRELQVLELSGANLSSLPKNIFKHNINLQQVQLDYNKLETLPKDIFINSIMHTVPKLRKRCVFKLNETKKRNPHLRTLHF